MREQRVRQRARCLGMKAQKYDGRWSLLEIDGPVFVRFVRASITLDQLERELSWWEQQPERPQEN
jgi:hypothetical protein